MVFLKIILELFGLILDWDCMKCVSINILVKKCGDYGMTCVHILWSTLLVCIEFVGSMSYGVAVMDLRAELCFCMCLGLLYMGMRFYSCYIKFVKGYTVRNSHMFLTFCHQL